MKPAHIIDCGDGPKIGGTRITVYTVLEYLRAGRSRDWIAAALSLSSIQVQSAMDFIQEHAAEVDAQYEQILERIRQGNPPHVQDLLRKNREKVKDRLARRHATSN